MSQSVHDLKQDARRQIVTSTFSIDQAFTLTRWINTFLDIEDTFDTALHLHACRIMKFVLAAIAEGDFMVKTAKDFHAPSTALQLSDYISHAGRILIDLSALGAENRQTLNHFFELLRPRTSTHSIQKEASGRWIEIKSTTHGATEFLKGKLHTIGETTHLNFLVKGTRLQGPPLTDFGINIQMGGFKKPNLSQGRSAFGLDGHILVHKKPDLSALLIGLEQSDPSQSSKDGYPENDNTIGLSGTHSKIGASDDYTAAGSLYFSNLIYKLKLYAATKTLTPIKYDGMNVKITDENFPRVMEIFASLEQSSSEEDLRQRLEMRPNGAQERVFREKELLAQINSKDVDMLFSQLEGLELLSSRDKTFKNLLKKKVDEINKLINQQEPDYQSVNPEHPVLDNEYLKLLEQVIHQALVQLHQEYITEALATLTNTEKLGQDALKVYELHRKYDLKNPQALQFNLAYETYAKNKSELDIYVKIENALFADGFRLCFELQKALQHLMTVIEVDEARMLLDMSNQIELLQLEMSRRAAIPVLETNIPVVESEEPVRPIVQQPQLLLNISQSIFNLKNLGILSSAICVGFLASILVPHASMSVIYGVVASTAIVAIFCFLKTISPNEPTQTVHLSPY